MKKRVHWLGNLPDSCQICSRPFGGTMYNARTSPLGPWANMCRACFVASGGQLGTGYGQEYERQRDGRWLKVAG